MGAWAAAWVAPTRGSQLPHSQAAVSRSCFQDACCVLFLHSIAACDAGSSAAAACSSRLPSSAAAQRGSGLLLPVASVLLHRHARILLLHPLHQSSRRLSPGKCARVQLVLPPSCAAPALRRLSAKRQPDLRAVTPAPCTLPSAVRPRTCGADERRRAPPAHRCSGPAAARGPRPAVMTSG